MRVDVYKWEQTFKEIVANTTNPWTKPLVHDYGDEAVFEFWYENKKITLDISKWGVQYTKVWGPDCNNEMEQDWIHDGEDFALCWSWLCS